MNKVIITVVGKDKVGIMARVCSYLAEAGINILDVSQTIVDGFFNMMMVTDANRSKKDFGLVVEEMEALGQEIGVIIRVRNEEIFNKMHRI